LAPSAMGARPMHKDLGIDPEVHKRMDPTQSVTMLNRHTFNNTVQQDLIDNWVVLFCVDWLEHCNGLWHDYRRMAMHWEQAMGSKASSFNAVAVRFAEVDCAVDKALCNENNVQNYPWAVHYKGGKMAAVWEISADATSLNGDLSKWIRKELEGKPAAEKAAAKAAAKQPLGQLTAARRLTAAHIKELSQLLSWKDPTTAAIGYVTLAVAVAVFVWIVGTGLELELATVLAGWSFKAETPKHWPTALLPPLPEMPASRTIVRNSLVL